MALHKVFIVLFLVLRGVFLYAQPPVVSAESKKDEEGSFESYYKAYLDRKVKDADAFYFLQKAFEVYPDNVELYDDFMDYYAMNDNLQGRRKFSKELSKSNVIPDYVLEYNYNVLASLPSDAVLFTNGFDDTYPIWVLQDVQNVRPDVKVVKINYLSDTVYRNKVLNELGLSYDNDLNGIKLVKNILEQNPDKPLYLPFTVDKRLIQALYPNLYPIGLVFKYAKTPVDNLPETQRVWEDNFKKTTLLEVEKPKKQRDFQVNYLIPLVNLYNYYIKIGEKEKAKSLKKYIVHLASGIGKKDYILSKLAK